MVLRRARAAVYRPEVTDEDRRRVAALVEADRQEREAVRAALAVADAPREDRAAPDPAVAAVAAAATQPRDARRRSLLVLGGALVAGVGLVGAGLVLTWPSHPAPARPKAAGIVSTPIPYLGGASEIDRAQADLDGLFSHPRTAFLGLYLAQHRTALSASIRTNSIAKDGTGLGPSVFSLHGIENDQPTGLLTILLACSRPTAYSWTLTAPGAQPIHVSGPECHGHVVAATFVPKPHQVPTELHVEVPSDVRVIWEADLSRY